jgi:hypothetical protein
MQIKGKHIVEEINGIRCSVIEKNASTQSVEFIKKMLEPNGYRVLVVENPINPKAGVDAPLTYKVGVTDIGFNLPVMLHIRKLKVPGTKKLLTHENWMNESIKLEN